MIKIFSIKEIINASDNILNTPKKIKVQNLKTKKNIKKSIISNIAEPLILNTEIKQNKDDSEKIKITNYEDLNNHNIINKQIIDELFNLFDKKIKKNTLKIIIEQQKEIKKLQNTIFKIRKNDYRNLKINKQLKNQILDLTNNEKILNFVK